ncbi:MAG: zinc ribbon domain-containing protein [Deltaproteobacteria bacterium]|nr:zinc ribbon domain-containing protein [Deltaproteobacteria bacterium]
MRNVLYIGQVCYKGVVYAGEQPAIVERALWERVQQQFKADTRRRVGHRRQVEVLLSGLLYCAQCGERLRNSYNSRQGRRYLYYVCRNKKADPKCQQKPVAAVDLEASLLSQLEPFLGPQPDRIVLQHSVQRVSYDARTRGGDHVAGRQRLRLQASDAEPARRAPCLRGATASLWASAARESADGVGVETRNPAGARHAAQSCRARGTRPCEPSAACARSCCSRTRHPPSKRRCCFFPKPCAAAIA